MAGHRDPELNPGAALRALPDVAPQPDLWPDIARSLARRRRSRVPRIAWPLAIAATLLIALLLPRFTVDPGAPASVASTPPQSGERERPEAGGEVDELRLRSQALERWIAAVSAHAPQDGRDLMAAVEVEDLIGLVDLQLGAARNAAEATPLWQRRVALLEDLAAIRLGGYAVAVNEVDAHAPRAIPALDVN